VRVCVASGGEDVVRLLRNADQNPTGSIPLFTVGDLVEIEG